MSKISLIKEIFKIKTPQFKNTIKTKKIKNNLLVISLLLFFSILSFYFVSTNEAYYNKTIAKVTAITENISQTPTQNGQAEVIKNQKITAIIMNGIHKGSEVQLENKTSYSQAYDLNLKVNDEVFIRIQQNDYNQIISSKILDFKRDKYIGYITILFMLLILLIGGLKGFRSLTSVVINILIFSAMISLFLEGYNLTLIAIISSILFIIISLFIVSGVNRKTISAILGTIIGTFISFLITIFVMWLCHSNGIHYEEMEFLTHPPEKIFLIEILIGTLGGIMDIAISISSSLNEIFDQNPNIRTKDLINSGLEIGKDIMGTMSNTLVLAYISGSIPLVLLFLKNKFPFSYIININLSLEIVRALTGSIGIVLSIPITIYTSVILLRHRKIGDL